MNKKIIKKVIIWFLIWISIWLSAIITNAVDITNIWEFPATWDILTDSWFIDLHSRIKDIYGSWTNVWIGVFNPTQKLEVNGNITWTSIKVTCIWNCF